MPSNKETLFQDHICAFLEREHGYHALTKAELPTPDFHIVESHLLAFIQATQPERYAELHAAFGLKTDDEIIRTLKQACAKAKPLWLVMREGLQVRGVKFFRVITSYAPAVNWRNGYAYTPIRVTAWG